MNSETSIAFSLGSCWATLFSLGIYYLVEANTNDGVYDGVLFKGDVFTKTSCTTSKNGVTSCSNTYYVEEEFYKGYNTTHSCTIRRPTQYHFKGDANAFVNDMQLYTVRPIYQTTYSHGTCFDDKIRYEYNICGGTFFGISMIPILILFFYICKYLFDLLMTIYKRREPIKTTDYHV